MIFFVLSGFVIAATTDAARPARVYAAARISRLLSVVLPALVATLLLDSLGSTLRPDFYYGTVMEATKGGNNFAQDALARYAVSALHMQGWWSIPLEFSHPGTNGPFWSLSFEALYYAVFGCLLFGRGPMMWSMPALLFLLSGPRFLVLAPIWISGALAWKYRARVPDGLGWPLVIGALALAVGFVLLKGELAGLERSFPAWLGHRPIQNYWAGAATLCLIVGITALARGVSVSARFAGAVRVVADHTFELYLLHIPALYFAVAISPWRVGSLAHLAWTYLFVAAIVVLVARLTVPLRGRIRRFVLRLLPASREPALP